MTKQTTVKWKEAFLGKCPRCGEGKIFNDPINLGDKCPNCGLELGKFETADGPAFFAISIVGTIVGLGAGFVEVMFQPHFWVHLALWTPVVAIGSLLIIRTTKSLMVAHQLKFKEK